MLTGHRPKLTKLRAVALAHHFPPHPPIRAIWSHRAITPINNWFEWVDDDSPKKQPYLIRTRDGAPALYAAIDQFPDADEGVGEHDGFVIITADSAGGMVDIHDRRPVVLSPELAREWLDPATPKERAVQGRTDGGIRVVSGGLRRWECSQPRLPIDPSRGQDHWR